AGSTGFCDFHRSVPRLPGEKTKRFASPILVRGKNPLWGPFGRQAGAMAFGTFAVCFLPRNQRKIIMFYHCIAGAC
ncbi:MAG: hypothetical protein DRH11_11740, partial [Deltaproteobacteria bacterium]